MKRTGLIFLILLAILAGCSTGNTKSAQTPETVVTTEPEQEADTMQKELILMIDDTAIPVIWEDNASVAELSEWASREPIHVDMRMYGGWEQVGSLGRSISRKDVQMTAGIGDIMLYSGDQIVLFYGENTWAYTKLGHITLPAEDLTDLLSCGAVHITLTVS